MNREQFEKELNERLATLKEEMIEELRQEFKEECEYKFPKFGEIYWYISSNGEVYCNIWEDVQADRDRLAIGNIFRTEEEAEFEFERRKVIAELKKYAEPKDRAWDEVFGNWFICYNYLAQEIRCCSLFAVRYTDIYFESEEKAREAIKAIGEDRIKKYYLGVA